MTGGKGIVKTCTMIPWWRRERNWTRILGARACTNSLRGRSCHLSDNKLQSDWSWWGPSIMERNRVNTETEIADKRQDSDKERGCETKSRIS